ncbi:MAG: OmpA family protein, partial [Bacteroidota bacterium]
GWESNGGPYYQTTRKGKAWGSAQGLGGGINQFFRRTAFATDGMTLSPDGSLFIVAAGADYAGKMDLFLAKRQRDGFWTYPRPLPLNTKQDERSVFMAGDGRTIYFASEGYGGLGGLDIFKTTLNADGSIGEIINIGAPFNTEQDDYGFIVRADGSEAFFIRDGDIYMADLRAADQDIKPLATLLLTGKVQDEEGEPVSGQILLLRQGKGVFSGQTLPNGAFALATQKGDGPYVLKFRSRQGQTVRQEITLSQEAGPEEQVVNLTIPARLEEPDYSIDTTPMPAGVSDLDSSYLVYFAIDEDRVEETYHPLLDQLGNLHALNDDLEILIVGHTDSEGSQPYNLELSARRVRAVLRKLVRYGARPSRMQWTFEGETAPAADNASSEGRALNRRVELRISQK